MRQVHAQVANQHTLSTDQSALVTPHQHLKLLLEAPVLRSFLARQASTTQVSILVRLARCRSAELAIPSTEFVQLVLLLLLQLLMQPEPSHRVPASVASS